MAPLVIILPLPSPKLSPNARCHHFAKASAVRDHRGWAKLVAKTEMAARRIVGGWKGAVVRPVFYMRDQRRRDKDNHGAMLKSYYDGLVDAGLLADDRGLVPMPVEFGVDRADPRVELHIEETR